MPNKVSDEIIVRRVELLQAEDPEITIRNLIPKAKTSRARLLDLESKGLIKIHRNSPQQIKRKIKNHRWSQASKFHKN